MINRAKYTINMMQNEKISENLSTESGATRRMTTRVRRAACFDGRDAAAGWTR